MLPDGIQFLKPGWWVIHALAVLFVYVFAYRKGRGDEQRRQRAKAMEKGER